MLPVMKREKTKSNGSWNAHASSISSTRKVTFGGTLWGLGFSCYFLEVNRLPPDLQHRLDRAQVDAGYTSFGVDVGCTSIWALETLSKGLPGPTACQAYQNRWPSRRSHTRHQGRDASLPAEAKGATDRWRWARTCNAEAPAARFPTWAPRSAILTRFESKAKTNLIIRQEILPVFVGVIRPSVLLPVPQDGRLHRYMGGDIALCGQTVSFLPPWTERLARAWAGSPCQGPSRGRCQYRQWGDLYPWLFGRTTPVAAASRDSQGKGSGPRPWERPVSKRGRIRQSGWSGNPVQSGGCF